MAQLRILGPVIYGVVGTRAVPVERIDPTKATKALQALGVRDEAAWLIARGRLDSTQARRLGQKYGLIQYDTPLNAPDADSVAKAQIVALDRAERRQREEVVLSL